MSFFVRMPLALVAVLLAVPANAQAGSIQIEREITSSKELSLEMGQNRLMETSIALGRVSVANPEVADLKVVTDRILTMIGELSK